MFLSDIIFTFSFTLWCPRQTRTGTPKRARILSPLCLPISPRGHVALLLLLLVYYTSFKEVKKIIFRLYLPV